jgi:IS5 family transposase
MRYDSQAIRRFVGMDLGRESAPDATTLLKFRRPLEDNKLTATIFETINRHLAAKGLMMRGGKVVDATIIASPSSTKNKKGKRAEQKSVKARWYVAKRPGKRRALPDSPMGRVLEELEQVKASVRAKVVHPFHIIKNLFGLKKVSYRDLAKNTARLYTLFGLANLMIVARRLGITHTRMAS